MDASLLSPLASPSSSSRRAWQRNGSTRNGCSVSWIFGRVICAMITCFFAADKSSCDMDASLLSPLASPSSSSRRAWQRNGSTRNGCSVSWIFGRVICAMITCFFAAVGSFVGAINGALIGLATESGLIGGAGIGAISGAVFCIEAVGSSVYLWNSRESGIWSVLYVVDIIRSLLTGRIVREKVDPAMQRAVQRQMSAVNLSFSGGSDFFPTDNDGGLPTDSVKKLPTIKIDTMNHQTTGENICCSVCLQDFESGETVRSLPHCQHMFHLPCIDSWLVRQGSCPVCRRDI